MGNEAFRNSSETLLWLTLAMPLVSFFLAALIPDRYSWTVSLFTPLLLLASTICALLLFIDMKDQQTQFVSLHWFSGGSHSITCDIALSSRAALMMLAVTSISFLVHLFSIGYMAGDQHLQRYFAVLGLFTFSMLGIVLADNLLVLFGVWELVGFCSYMLVAHYQDDKLAGSAAKKAFIINRLGDLGFLVGIMLVWANTGTLTLAALLDQPNESWQTLASLCFFCGVIGKSAQLPLSVWLPDAMKGPTPASALIHAATMVAAGVYLLTRISFLLTPGALNVIALTGAFTALYGAACALHQYDIKRVLAYSTVSQLGLMIAAVGLGNADAAFFHLLTHAFFKACLFLCAGSVIHALHHFYGPASAVDVQDLRSMGGLRKAMPVTFIAMSMAGASLAGLPFFSGFLSKEAILETALGHPGLLGKVVTVLIIIVSLLTVVYTFRLMWFIFMANSRTQTTAEDRERLAVPMIMQIPVMVLAGLSTWIVFSPNPFEIQDGIQHHVLLPALTSLLIIGALVLSFFYFRSKSPATAGLFQRGMLLNEAYWSAYQNTIPVMSNLVVLTDQKILDRLIKALALVHVTTSHLLAWFDRAVVDGLVDFFAGVVRSLGKTIRLFQAGKIQLYIFWAIVAIIIFLIWNGL